MGDAPQAGALHFFSEFRNYFQKTLKQSHWNSVECAMANTLPAVAGLSATSKALSWFTGKLVSGVKIFILSRRHAQLRLQRRAYAERPLSFP